MQRLLKSLPILLLSAFLYSLVVTGRIEDYVDGRLVPLLLITALGLFWVGISYLRPGRPGTTPTPVWWGVWLLLLPIMVGWLARQPVPAESEPAYILYLGWDAAGRQQLFKVLPGEASEALTQVAAGQNVIDYAPAPDGELVAYAVRSADGRSDIWTIDLDGQLPYPLLDCLDAACRNPVWSPDGTRLVYERRPVVDGNGVPDRARLWWLDAQTGDTLPVFADPEVLGLEARFAPNGRWLSFLSPGSQEIRLYNLETAEVTTLASETGAAGTWHPTADRFYFTNIVLGGESIWTHLFELNLADGATTDLSGRRLRVDDSSPAWSPDGRWLAFTRKPARTPAGRQIWLMRPDGPEARSLTDEPDIHHGPPRWSPDGSRLVFQRFDIQRPNTDPSIWLYDLRSETLQLLAPTGTQPAWIHPD